MIHELPTPVRGASHVNITRGIKDETGNAITIEGVFGELATVPPAEEGGEATTGFHADPDLTPYSRAISQWEVEDVFKPFAAARGNYPGDTRLSDVIAFWDVHNLWDRASQVPAPVNT